jgi:hypothetical protein
LEAIKVRKSFFKTEILVVGWFEVLPEGGGRKENSI